MSYQWFLLPFHNISNPLDVKFKTHSLLLDKISFYITIKYHSSSHRAFRVPVKSSSNLFFVNFSKFFSHMSGEDVLTTRVIRLVFYTLEATNSCNIVSNSKITLKWVKKTLLIISKYIEKIYM